MDPAVARDDIPGRGSGVIKEYPVLGGNGRLKYGVGLIDDDMTRKSISFHVRFLINGHEDDLEPGTRLSYVLWHHPDLHLQPTDIRFEDVEERYGKLNYDDDVDIGVIEAEDDQQQFRMDFDSIIGRLPEEFTPRLCVSFTPAGEVATNIRFVGLPPCRGRIRFFDDERKFGFLVPDAGGADVVFMEAGIRNIAEVNPNARSTILADGTPATYELQRVPPLQRETYGKKGVKATNVCLQHPSLVVIHTVIHHGPQDCLADVPPLPHCSIQGGAHEVVEIEEVGQPPSEADPSLRSSYLGTCSLVRLSFTRSPPEFQSVLDQHGSLSFRLASGAFVLAPPSCDAGIMAISPVLKHLGPWDVIAPKELEASVNNSVQSLPRKHKVSLKRRVVIHVKQDRWKKDRNQWVTKNTFIHVPDSEFGDGPLRSALSAPSR